MDATTDAVVDASAEVGMDEAPPLPTSRLLSPQSVTRVTSQRPTLRWTLDPGLTDSRVEVCTDRPCTHVLATLETTDTAVRLVTPLPPGVAFWRVTARGPGSATWRSPTWEFTVGHRDAPVDTSFGTLRDFNGDGYDDVAVAVTNEPLLLDGSGGEVLVYGGGPTGLTATPQTTILNPDGPDDGFGYAMAPAGDVDGDGFGDLIVSEVYWGPDGHWDHTGRARVYFGGPLGIDPTSSVPLDSGEHGRFASFGSQLSAGGDFNGDGISDIVVGSRERIGIFLGNGRRDAIGAGAHYSFMDTSRSILTLSAVGDVNGDGFADALIVEVASAGETYELLQGGPGGLILPRGAVVPTGLGSPGSSQSITAIGDLDMDGMSDILIANDAEMRVIYGSRSSLRSGPLIEAPTDIGGTVPAAYFSVHTAPGDFNGDGLPDMIIGASCAPPDPSAFEGCGRGQSYWYPSSRGGLPSVPATTYSAPPSSGNFGDIQFAADVDGDGFDDLLVGAALFGGGITTDCIYLYRGGTGGPMAGSLVPLIAPADPNIAAFGVAIAIRIEIPRDSHGRWRSARSANLFRES